MDTITVPSSVYLKSATNDDVNDGPAPILITHLLSNGKRTLINPNSFTLRNSDSITLSSKKWKTIILDATILTSLPALCVGICNLRTLYYYGLTQGLIVFNTNDSRVKIQIYNNTTHSVTLPPYRLMVQCAIILRPRFLRPLVVI